MPTPQPPPPKKEVALALLERSSILVHLDPRLEPVAVPAWFKKQPQLVLQVGLNMPVPIPDLRLDDDGMSCTLSFNRAPFFCVVPWSSVFAMVGEDGRGMVWPDDVPADVARQAQVRPVEAPPPGKEPAPRPVPGRERVARAVAAVDGPKAKRPRKRPALAAVPDDEAGAPAKLGAAVRATPPAPSRPAVSPLPQAAPRSAGGTSRSKQRRELPPYLRVVK